MILENIKLLLGEAAENYTDELLKALIFETKAEVGNYCNRVLDESFDFIICRIVLCKINRMKAEGISAVNYGGISENYIDGYPADILAALNRKRKIKVI